jgi:predicted acyltransferase
MRPVASPNPPGNPDRSRRIEAIDQFRGFAILLMVLANYAAMIETLPAWLKHAPGSGLTVIDLIAPLFIYAIGLTYGLSAQRRRQHTGSSRTREHFIRRGLGLIGIGCIISSGENILGLNPGRFEWGVLQAIGASILVSLPLIQKPWWTRLLAGSGLLIVFQFCSVYSWAEVLRDSPHGGLPGVLAWSSMLLLATVLADLYHDYPSGRKYSPWAAVLVLVCGVGLSLALPISKTLVSPSYVLISLGASGLCFWVFHLLTTWLNLRWRVFNTWGRNPLLLYLTHYVLLGLLVLPEIPALYTQAPLWLVVVEAITLVTILSQAGLYLEHREWFVSL